MQTIVFEVNGEEHEAFVEDTPYPRPYVSEGQLVVEHSSCNYAVSVNLHRFGGWDDSGYEYIANPIQENT
jgi:hypothetical protein